VANYFAYYSTTINICVLHQRRYDKTCEVGQCLDSGLLENARTLSQVLAANFLDSCRWRVPAYRRFIALANPFIVGASE